MKIPVVKEWGSWVVFVSSLLAALTAGLLTQPWETDRDFSGLTIITILGLTLLVNSKNPLASALKTRWKKKEHVLWFLLFSISAHFVAL